jgi:hypothetical protein
MIYLKNIGLFIEKHFGTMLAVGVLLWIYLDYRGYKKDSITAQVSPKEEDVKKLPEVKPSGEINHPISILNQIHLDSSFWKHAQHNTVITNVWQKPGEVDVQKVDSTGKRTDEIHKVQEGSTVNISKDGTVTEKKASFLSQLKVYGGGEVGVNQNGLTNIAPQIILVSPTGWVLNGSYNVMNNTKTIGLAKKISFKRK